MSLSVTKVKKYMGAGLNISVEGPAGTGKTAILQTGADELNWNMKYFSASTLDVFTDLIGIPVPDTKRKLMEFYRDNGIDEADVIFFDEVNRAPDHTINSIFEVTQFRSLNGKKLPRLKSVVVAFNPVAEGYVGNEELDVAFLDRFDIRLKSTIDADKVYFENKYGKDFANAALSIFEDYQESYKTAMAKGGKMAYFSPRLLDKMMFNFRLFPSVETIKDTLPGDIAISKTMAADKFNQALGNTKPRRRKPAASGSVITPEQEELLEAQLRMGRSEMRANSNRRLLKDALGYAALADAECNSARKTALLHAAAGALSTNVSAGQFRGGWKEIAKEMTPSQLEFMSANWTDAKKLEVGSILGVIL